MEPDDAGGTQFPAGTFVSSRGGAEPGPDRITSNVGASAGAGRGFIRRHVCRQCRLLGRKRAGGAGPAPRHDRPAEPPGAASRGAAGHRSGGFDPRQTGSHIRAQLSRDAPGGAAPGTRKGIWRGDPMGGRPCRLAPRDSAHRRRRNRGRGQAAIRQMRRASESQADPRADGAIPAGRGVARSEAKAASCCGSARRDPMRSVGSPPLTGGCRRGSEPRRPGSRCRRACRRWCLPAGCRRRNAVARRRRRTQRCR